MISLRKFVSLCSPLLLAAVLACAPDAPTQPSPSPTLDLVSDIGGVVSGGDDFVGGALHGLLSCSSSRSYSSSASIGPAGGALRVGPHTLFVPRGALRRTVRISADAPAGDIVQVHFEPEGLQFARPTYLTMSYAQCGLVNGLLLKVVYIDEDRSILETLLSVPNVLNRTVTGRVSHFSNYALAE